MTQSAIVTGNPHLLQFSQRKKHQQDRVRAWKDKIMVFIFFFHICQQSHCFNYYQTTKIRLVQTEQIADIFKRI